MLGFVIRLVSHERFFLFRAQMNSKNVLIDGGLTFVPPFPSRLSARCNTTVGQSQPFTQGKPLFTRPTLLDRTILALVPWGRSKIVVCGGKPLLGFGRDERLSRRLGHCPSRARECQMVYCKMTLGGTAAVGLVLSDIVQFYQRID